VLVLRQILSALKNSEIPCRDGCPIQVIPFTLERQESLPGNPERYTCIFKDGGTRTFQRRCLVRIRQPDRTGDAALPGAHEKGRDLRLWCEFFRLAFPSRARDACGLRGNSEYTQRAGV
jgi:hypothetical protein